MTPTLSVFARSARRASLVACALALAAMSSGAQSIGAAKKAATNAAAKTNERLEKQTGQPPQTKTPAPGSKSAGPAQPPATRQRPGAPGRSSVAERAPQDELSLEREVFTYTPEGRDPFRSLIASGDLRPLLTDLKLVGIIYDPSGRNSVAVMRDISTTPGDQYRVRTGQMVGRMRVTAIRPREVVFTIEEFGFSRQESLALIDTTKVRSP
jgi:hypothetical protein